jgi:hypothetical protein
MPTTASRHATSSAPNRSDSACNGLMTRVASGARSSDSRPRLIMNNRVTGAPSTFLYYPWAADLGKS